MCIRDRLLPDVASPCPIPLSESEQIVDLRKELAWAKLKIQVLEEQLRLQRIKKYGPGSEKLSDAQLQLLEFEPCLLYTSDAADDLTSVDLGGRRIINKKKNK